MAYVLLFEAFQSSVFRYLVVHSVLDPRMEITPKRKISNFEFSESVRPNSTY